MSFDLRTKTMNKKGQVVSESPYTLFVENGVRVFERPPGSGQFFYENGETIKPEHRPSAAPAPAPEPKPVDQKELRRKTRALNEKLQEFAADEDSDKNKAPELTDDDQDALDAILKESK